MAPNTGLEDYEEKSNWEEFKKEFRYWINQWREDWDYGLFDRCVGVLLLGCLVLIAGFLLYLAGLILWIFITEATAVAIGMFGFFGGLYWFMWKSNVGS